MTVQLLFMVTCLYQRVHPTPKGAVPKSVMLCPACTHLLDRQPHVTITNRKLLLEPRAGDRCVFCHRKVKL
jgi:hypothetical protein